jgi:xanthine dehydrogenase accessory factor
LVTLLESGRAVTAHVDERQVILGAAPLTPDQRRRILNADDVPPLKPGQAARAGQAGNPYAYSRFLAPSPLLYIFGGGHVGLETAKVCAGLDFEMVVVDDREEYASPARFPQAARCLVAAGPADLPALAVDGDTYILIMTRGHLLDYQWLRWAMTLPAPPRYVGMLGSRRKISAIAARLRQEAGVPQDRIDQLRSPVGLALGAKTPAEIAVSVGAELIQIRRGG